MYVTNKLMCHLYTILLHIHLNSLVCIYSSDSLMNHYITLHLYINSPMNYILCAWCYIFGGYWLTTLLTVQRFSYTCGSRLTHKTWKICCKEVVTFQDISCCKLTPCTSWDLCIKIPL